MRRCAVPALLLLLSAAAAAPQPELVRQERFNFRIVGKLPPGWKRSGERFVWAYAIEGIPHAYVHLNRERLRGQTDVEAAMKARTSHYAFPGQPKDAPPGRIVMTAWGGRQAVLYEFETKVNGVVCRRRVMALCVKSIWYELIETTYGAAIAKDHRCHDGLAVFRNGFRILAPPVPEAELDDLKPGSIAVEEGGFSLRKPEGFARREVDTGADPGCRVLFEARAGDHKKTARVRVFEYGRRPVLDGKQWVNVLWGSFAGLHTSNKRTRVDSPTIPGTKLVHVETFEGIRDRAPVKTTIYLVHTLDNRVLVLRTRLTGDAEAEFGKQLAAVVESFRVN